MATGRATLSEIENAIADLRSTERAAQQELKAANQKRAQLMKQRTQAFRQLAQVRAKDALSDGIIDRADRLSHRVASLLGARQKTIDLAEQRLAEATAHYDSQISKSKPLQDEIEDLEHQLDKFATKAREELATQTRYFDLTAQLKSLHAMHANANKKAERSNADRKAKGRDFENDILFMYLWNRSYRRDGYKPYAIIRWADDQVARIIDYNQARTNYAMLLEIPQRLSEHAANLRAKIEHTSTQLETLESTKTEELAGKAFLSRLENTRKREAELNLSIEELSAEMAEISTQLNTYAQGRDSSFLKAVEMSASFLEQSSLNQLTRLARATQIPTDDEIVAGIARIDQKNAALAKDIDNRRGNLEKLSARREELIRVAADFRRSHYDQPGSIFVPDDDLGYILEQLVKGAITGSEYWTRTGRRHRWNPRAADPFRRRSGFPPFGGSDFGRTWKSRGGSTGRFETGGGF